VKKKWTILVSNDDGIDAPGIFALVGELKKIGNVIVVAPDEQRSAVGHAITMNYPLRVKKFYKNGKFFGYAVEGTPADSVKIGVRTVLGKNPDLLVSVSITDQTRQSISSIQELSRQRRKEGY